VFAEAAGGDRYALEAADPPGVLHLRPGSDERWRAGSTFSRWLDATLARELLLYDAEGEFVLEAFEADGEELTPLFAMRQAERALRKDPDSAETHHDLAVALRRSGRLARARDHFARATELDPDNPWPWFDRARADLAAAAPADAVPSFRRAAEVTPGPEGARFLAWAARAAIEAGLPEEAERARKDALARDPDLVESLGRAVDAAAEDEDARAEAEHLREALTPRRRLPVVRHP
jgi:tetratricopeptide (TPR) repeat protein